MALRWRLIIFSLLIILPLLVVAGAIGYLYVSIQQERIEDEANALVREAARSIDIELQRYSLALQVLAKSDYLAQGHFEALHRLAKNLSDILPESGIALRRPDHQTIFNTLFPYGTKLPAEEAPQLIEADQAAIRDQKVTISNVFVDNASRRPFVALVQPIVSEGSVVYLLSLGVAARDITRVVSDKVPSKDWLIGVTGPDNRIIARTWDHDKFVGKPASESFIENTRDDAGAFIATSLDGVQLSTCTSAPHLAGGRWLRDYLSLSLMRLFIIRSGYFSASWFWV